MARPKAELPPAAAIRALADDQLQGVGDGLEADGVDGDGVAARVEAEEAEVAGWVGEGVASGVGGGFDDGDLGVGDGLSGVVADVAFEGEGLGGEGGGEGGDGEGVEPGSGEGADGQSHTVDLLVFQNVEHCTDL